MIIDAQNRPSNAQSVAITDTTALSTDSIDLLTANRNLGRAGPMRALCEITTALVGGTSLKVELITSADGALGTPTVIATGPTVLTAAGVIGKIALDVPVPDTAQRYLGFRYTVAGTMSAGKVTSAIVANTQRPANQVTMNTGR